jgi:ABC-type transporter Mla subunit MlaD
VTPNTGYLYSQKGTRGGKIGQLSGNVGQLSGSIGQLSGNIGQLSGNIGQLSGDIGQLQGTMASFQGTLASKTPVSTTKSHKLKMRRKAEHETAITTNPTKRRTVTFSTPETNCAPI